jgi:hypothetical protein
MAVGNGMTPRAGQCLVSRHSSALSRDIVPISGRRGGAMSLAQLVSPRSGPRDGPRRRCPATTGSLPDGSTSSADASMPMGKRGCSRGLAGPVAALGGHRSSSRTRSSSCERRSPTRASTRAHTRSRSTWHGVTARLRSLRSRGSGGSSLGGGSSPPAPEAAAELVRPVLCRDAQRALAGRHRPRCASPVGARSRS